MWFDFQFLGFYKSIFSPVVLDQTRFCAGQSWKQPLRFIIYKWSGYKVFLKRNYNWLHHDGSSELFSNVILTISMLPSGRGILKVLSLPNLLVAVFCRANVEKNFRLTKPTTVSQFSLNMDSISRIVALFWDEGTIKKQRICNYLTSAYAITMKLELLKMRKKRNVSGLSIDVFSDSWEINILWLLYN